MYAKVEHTEFNLWDVKVSFDRENWITAHSFTSNAAALAYIDGLFAYDSVRNRLKAVYPN